MADDWFEAISSRQDSGFARVFAICSKAEFVGVISLNNIDPDLRKAEVDYWVGAKFQGNGIATEAVSQVLAFAVNNLAIKRFTSGALKRNEASHAVQEKNGFVVVDEFKLTEGKFSGDDYVVSQLEIS